MFFRLKQVVLWSCMAHVFCRKHPTYLTHAANVFSPKCFACQNCHHCPSKYHFCMPGTQVPTVRTSFFLTVCQTCAWRRQNFTNQRGSATMHTQFQCAINSPACAVGATAQTITSQFAPVLQPTIQSSAFVRNWLFVQCSGCVSQLKTRVFTVHLPSFSEHRHLEHIEQVCNQSLWCACAMLSCIWKCAFCSLARLPLDPVFLLSRSPKFQIVLTISVWT